MELWDAYDRDEKRTGGELVRGEPIPDGLYHLVCEVLVRHTDGDYLLMKRAQTKKGYPGLYEATAGGSALKGEAPIDCIRRELREETGIERGAFTLIVRHVFDSGHCICYDYLCTTDCDKDGIVLQDGETEGWKWLSEDEFIAFVNSDEGILPQKERFKPYFTENGYLRG